MQRLTAKWNVYLKWCEQHGHDPYDMDALKKFEDGGAVYSDEYGELFLEDQLDLYHSDVYDALFDARDTDVPKMQYEEVWS